MKSATELIYEAARLVEDAIKVLEQGPKTAGKTVNRAACALDSTKWLNKATEALAVAQVYASRGDL